MLTVGQELHLAASRDAWARGMGLKAAHVLRTGFQQAAADLPRGKNAGDIAAFMARAAPALGGAYQKIADQALRDLEVLAKARGQTLQQALGGSDGVLLTAERLMAVTKLPLAYDTLGQWWKKEVNAMTERMRSGLQQGLLRGLSMRDLARSLTGTDPRDRSAYRAALARAMTVSRTTASAVASETDALVFGSMKNLTTHYIYRATMDNRTSDVCRVADGKVFAYDAVNALKPPLHPNCRSTIIPLVKGTKVPRDGRLPDTRTVAEYEAWMKAQPPRIQKQILGTSWEAYRKGTMGVVEAMATNEAAYLTEAELVKALAPVVDTAVEQVPVAEPAPTVAAKKTRTTTSAKKTVSPSGAPTGPDAAAEVMSVSSREELHDALFRATGAKSPPKSIGVERFGRSRGAFDPWTKKLYLTPEVDDAVNGWVAGQRERRNYRAVHTLMHEMFHNRTRIRSMYDYHGPTGWLEEGVVERSARRMLATVNRGFPDLALTLSYSREVKVVDAMANRLGESLMDLLLSNSDADTRFDRIRTRTMKWLRDEWKGRSDPFPEQAFSAQLSTPAGVWSFWERASKVTKPQLPADILYLWAR